tara:strand:+ start:2149 stop:2406 length:258 start_codon:yes stop_codon:yes gene_type:complete
MNTESILTLDLKMYPDLVSYFEDCKVGDKIEYKGEFQLKELSESRATLSFEDIDSISKSKSEAEDEDSEDTDDEGAEESIPKGSK